MKKNFDKIGSWLVELMGLIWFSINYFDYCRLNISNKIIRFDEAWNASIAANLIRGYGYRSLYNTDKLFPVVITTGQNVIMSTAFIFKLFGISNFSSAFIALLYMILAVFVFWLVFRISIKSFNIKFYGIISVILCLGVFLTKPNVEYCSSGCMGESAELFFSLLGVLFVLIYQKKTYKWMFFSGSCFANAFIAKPEAIVVIIPFLGMIFIESIIRKNIKYFLSFLYGLLCGILILDIYKIYLRGAFGYIEWWKEELNYMFGQVSGVDTYTFADKIEYLPNIFGFNKWLCCIVIILPIILYMFYGISKVVKKKELFNSIDRVILIVGISGSFLEIYFLLFGKGGLIFPRRHFLSAIFCDIFANYMICFGIAKFLHYCRTQNCVSGFSKDFVSVISCMLFVVMSISPYKTIQNQINSILARNKISTNYEYSLMQNFLEKIDLLPEDATLYTYGWWQEPNITLFLNRKMVMYSKVTVEDFDFENGYFIIGQGFVGTIETVEKEMYDRFGVRLQKVDDIKIDPDKNINLQLYSIYKII